MVQSAFRPANYHSLRDLPNDLGPFSVGQSIKERMQNGQLQSSVISENNKAANVLLPKNGGLFQQFEWIEDPYDTEKKLARQQRQTSEMKRVSDSPFNPGTIKKQYKYDYPFLAKNETSTYTFLAQGDPYEVVKEERMRSRWIEEAKLLFGDFVPSGSTKPIKEVQRSQLPNIVDVIKKLLLADWNDVNFVIGSKSNTNVGCSLISFLLCFSEPEGLYRSEVRHINDR